MRPAIDLNFRNAERLGPRVSFSRASGGTVIDRQGVLREIVPGQARFDFRNGICRGILQDPADTNFIRNPRFEGGTVGVIGAGGAWPTNVSLWANGVAGLTVERLANQTINGRTVVVGRIFGTANTSAGQQIFIDNASLCVPPVGVPARHQFEFALLAGSFANISSFAATSVGPGNTTTQIVSLAGPTLAPFSVMSNPGDGVANTRTRLAFFPSASGAAVDFTFGLAVPGIYIGPPIQRSPILNPVGVTNATTTRAAESWSALLAAWGLVPQVPGTMLFTGDAADGGNPLADELLCALDDGTSANAVRLLRRANGTARFELVTGSTLAGSVDTTTTITPGQAFNLMAAWEEGSVALSLNGAAPVTLTQTGFPATLGRISGGSGYCTAGRVAWWPARLTNAQLQLLTA